MLIYIILYYTFFQWVHNGKKERKKKKEIINSTFVTFQSLSFNEATPSTNSKSFCTPFPSDRFVSNVKYHVLLKRYYITRPFYLLTLCQKKKEVNIFYTPPNNHIIIFFSKKSNAIVDSPPNNLFQLQNFIFINNMYK